MSCEDTITGCYSCLSRQDDCNTCNDGCQSCNSCQKCNENCNGDGCVTIQTFVALNQTPGGFSFGQDLEKDDDFLSKTNWNRLITYINEAYAKGASEDNLENNAKSGDGVAGSGKGGESGLPESDSNVFMTAAMFNKIASALGNLGSTSAVTFYNPITKEQQSKMTGGPDGDIIFGSYFTTLEAYANNLQYKSTQCNNCNAGCNIQCNTCLTCNDNKNCGSCDEGCQANCDVNCQNCNDACQDEIPECCGGQCTSSCQERNTCEGEAGAGCDQCLSGQCDLCQKPQDQDPCQNYCQDGEGQPGEGCGICEYGQK